MRLSRLISALVLAMTLASVPAFATPLAHDMLELRSLLGDWIGRSDDGEMVHTSFRLAPDGRVVQVLRARHSGVVTVYGTPEASVSATSLSPKPSSRRAPASPAPATRTARTAAPDNVSFIVDDGGHHTERWSWRIGSRVHTTVVYFTRESERF